MRYPVAALGLVACVGIDAIEAPDFEALGRTEQAQVELGHALFFDPGLSADGQVSCATCHRPDHGGAEPLATSLGVFGQVGRRNAPSVWTAALVSPLFWDGRADTLEEQALGPLLAEDEMGADEASVVAYLDGNYAAAWEAAFPERSGADLEGFAQAIAAYERQLVAPGRVDAFLQGDREALTEQEVAGYRMFRRRCSFCHSGAGVGGEGFERLGDEVPWPDRSDLGVFERTGDPDDEHVFRVPSLRAVGETAPYFHDGSVATLREAVVLMGKHQLGTTFSSEELDELVAFLRALSPEVSPRWRDAPAPR
jgi:cytochrome c peroxidase